MDLPHKHFFFDLDNTLTRSKSKIEQAHAAMLLQLSPRADIVAVSGSRESVISDHLEGLRGVYHMLSQNGNYAEHRDGKVLWNRTLAPFQKEAIERVVRKMIAFLSLPINNPDDIFEDRGSQMSYSLIGHHENIALKEKVDPDFMKRKELLRQFSRDIRNLEEEVNIEVRIGGTTCLDFFERGKHKGYNIAEFIRERGWEADRCIYFGDALFPGGNDETVIGVIPTQPVKDYRETYRYLASML